MKSDCKLVVVDRELIIIHNAPALFYDCTVLVRVATDTHIAQRCFDVICVLVLGFHLEGFDVSLALLFLFVQLRMASRSVLGNLPQHLLVQLVVLKLPLLALRPQLVQLVHQLALQYLFFTETL